MWLETSAGRRFLAIHAPAANAKGAVVVVHGIGVHPDHGMIGVLRTKLADLGWTTLSIQMPVQAADARLEAYYPAAVSRGRRPHRPRGRVAAGPGGEARSPSCRTAWARGWPTSTSTRPRQSPFAAWACLGLTGGYSLATWFSPRPILDVYGENDLEPSVGAAWRRRLTLASAPAGSRQVMIAGADHFYAGKEDELARAVSSWLAEVLREAL